MKLEATLRGFDYGEFTDKYGDKCSIQKSSSATEDAIWFGISDANPQIMAVDAEKLGLTPTKHNGWVKYEIPEEVLLSTRMHLTQEILFKLIPYLEEFLDTGELKDGYEYDFERCYAIDSFSDDYELKDFENMAEQLENSEKRIQESFARMKERRNKLQKYLKGVKLAKKNMKKLIEDEK
jgi:hypothetical protein